MKEKYAKIIAAVILIVMGIIIAVVGAGALDLYFGIGCLVAGGVLVILNIIALAKSKQITFAQLFLSTALIVLGVSFIWTHYVSFTMLINFRLRYRLIRLWFIHSAFSEESRYWCCGNDSRYCGYRFHNPLSQRR